MHACSDYTIKMIGSEEEIRKATAVLALAFDDEEYIDEDFFDEELVINEETNLAELSIDIEETYEVVWVHAIADLSEAMATAAPGLKCFTITGVVDTSESAGEYMNFLIKYEEGKLSVQSSCWYLIIDADDFLTYEDFCDVHPGYTEEQFEEMRKCPYYVLDSGEGPIVTEVPLDEPEVVDMKAKRVYISMAATELSPVPVCRCECGEDITMEKDDSIYGLYVSDSLPVACPNCGKHYRVFLNDEDCESDPAEVFERGTTGSYQHGGFTIQFEKIRSLEGAEALIREVIEERDDAEDWLDMLECDAEMCTISVPDDAEIDLDAIEELMTDMGMAVAMADPEAIFHGESHYISIADYHIYEQISYANNVLSTVIIGSEHPDGICPHCSGEVAALDDYAPGVKYHCEHCGKDLTAEDLFGTIDYTSFENVLEGGSFETQNIDHSEIKGRRRTMAAPHFYCDLEALNLLLGMDFPGEREGIDLSIDVIDVPFTFYFSVDEENRMMTAHKRGELHSLSTKGILIGKVTINKETGNGPAEATSAEIGESLGAFYAACLKLGYFVQDNISQDIYADFNPDETGILLYVEDEKLAYKVVSGKDRPDMMCSTLFGDTVMMRPYMDDFMERSEFEMMDFEEKLEAAEEGDMDAMMYVAMVYLNGDDEVEEDAEQAVYWFEKLAEAGSSDGQFNLGLHYAKGFGVERDFDKAVYWMERAAENGDEDAPGVLVEYRKAVAAEAKLAVDENDAQAQADLAAVLMGMAGSLDQAGPGKDYEDAFELAKKSAAQDNGDGLWTLALAYEHGRGVEEDKEKAVECYRRGAELGHAPSLHSLACYYMRGEVVEEDMKRGFDLMMKSAEQGYGLALLGIGRCYQFANGVECNMPLAIKWYEKYLETNDDPEMERKVGVFKMLEESGAFTEPEEGEDDIDEFLDDEEMDAVFEAMEADGEDVATVGSDIGEFFEGEEYDAEEADSDDEVLLAVVSDEEKPLDEESAEEAAAAAAAAAAIAALAEEGDEAEEPEEEAAPAAEPVKAAPVEKAAPAAEEKPEAKKDTGSRNAVASVIWGLLSILSACFIPFAIIGLVQANKAKKKGNTSGVRKLGKSLSTAGLILNIIITLLIIAVVTGIGALVGSMM